MTPARLKTAAKAAADHVAHLKREGFTKDFAARSLGFPAASADMTWRTLEGMFAAAWRAPRARKVTGKVIHTVDGSCAQVFRPRGKGSRRTGVDQRSIMAGQGEVSDTHGALDERMSFQP